MALTSKQKRFVQEYMVDLNATQAAVRAGYSRKTAGSIGQENLKKPAIQAELQVLMQERGEKTTISQEMVVKELQKIAFADASDVAVSELKYSNKIRALELLGKHLGMYVEKVEHSGEAGIRIELAPEMGELAE